MEKPKTLQQAIQHFSNEQTCIDAVAAMRWPKGAVCPACETKNPYYLKSQKRWKCRECDRQFSVKLGTIFEDSPISLQKWLVALWMLANCRNGISSYELHRALGVSQKSAWFMLHRIRLALQGDLSVKIGGSGNEVEADETFIGGKTKNMHKNRRLALQKVMSETVHGDTRLIGKTAVMGILDREQRKVRAIIVPNIKRNTLQEEILKQVHHGSKLYTDESTSYQGMAKEYTHEFVNHLNQYVNGRVHTNGIENFWSLLKRGLNGTYVAVEPFVVHPCNLPFADNAGINVLGKDRQIPGKSLQFVQVSRNEGQMLIQLARCLMLL
jgi:transposase-like protein